MSCVKGVLKFIFWTIPCLLLDGLLLIAFVICLIPAWIRFLWFYAVTSHRRSVRYAKVSCRQTLDVYCLDRPALVLGHRRYCANAEGGGRSWFGAGGQTRAPNTDSSATTDANAAGDLEDGAGRQRPPRADEQAGRLDASSASPISPATATAAGTKASTEAPTGSGASAPSLLPSATCSEQDHVDESFEGECDDERRNSLEPDQHSALMLAPVVVFCPGGAWLIGYKMWGALLARVLTAAGIVVVIPDYRNYPWATVPDMVTDVEHAVNWTHDNIAMFGGEKEKIVLVGQSAGGHLATTMVLRRAIDLLGRRNHVATSCALPSSSTNGARVGRNSKPQNVATPSSASSEEHEANSVEDIDHVSQSNEMLPSVDDEEAWSPKHRIRGLISLSAPHDLEIMGKTFMRHGLDSTLTDRIFGNRRQEYDPFALIQSIPPEQHAALADMLPPVQIRHGTADKTVPHEGSRRFAEVLGSMLGPDRVTFASYEGWSHTDPILEAPMAADHRFHLDLFTAVRRWTDSSNIEWPSEDDPLISGILCPRMLIKMARCCNPF